MALQTFGRYQLIKKIATGGMGEIFLARQKGPVGFQKQVVVKRLLKHLSREPEFITQFFDEARIAALLNHPHIAQIYDLGETAGGYYIAMEYVHGENLRVVCDEAIRSERDMPLALKCRVVADAAAGLEYAHHAKSPSGQALGLIHRDVSPQNVIVGFAGSVKLIDFGVAKAANKLHRTASGIIKGKYAYMSPEQGRGEELDARSDVFGLGVVFYELLTDTRLFRRENDTATLKAVVGHQPPPPSQLVKGIPKAIDAIVMKALEKRRDDRYASAGALQRDLEAVLTRQRLPATSAHLQAFMADLFPSRAAEEQAEDEPTMSSSHAGPNPATARPSSPPVPGRQKKKATPKGDLLDPRELELRIGATQPDHVVFGLFFTAIESAVLRARGPAVKAALEEALDDPRQWVDGLTYPTAELLRLLWRAVELLAPQIGGAEEAFAALGEQCLRALLRSTLGKPLERLAGEGEPGTLAAPLVAMLQRLISPGERRVVKHGKHDATLVLKNEVLPVQFYSGLLTAAFEKLRGVHIACGWEKTAGSRIEMRLSW